MIVCTNCGNHNEDSDEFCGSCGKFLEWVGQRIEEPAQAEVAAAPAETEEAKVGLIDRVKAAVGIDSPSSGAGMADTAGDVTPTPPPVDPEVVAAEAQAAAVVEEQERARLEADAADQAARERRAVEEAEQAERERVAAAEASAAAAAAQAAAEDAARAAAAEQARLEAETAERARAAAAAEATAQAAEQERLTAEAAAAEAAAAERDRLEAEARAAAEAAERERLAAAAEAAAAEAARQAEEEGRRQAEEAAARARAEEEARRTAEAEETRRRAEEERARREAETRAEAARRAAALLAQPKAPAEPVVDAPAQAAPAATAAPISPSAPVVPSPPKRGVPAAPPGQAAMAPSQEPAKPKAPPKPATQTAVDDSPKPGDLVCDSCGTGNDPARKFCRRCGNSLAKAEPAKKVPWWKRIFQRRKGPRPRGGRKGSKAASGARQASFKAEMAMARLRNAMMLLAAVGVGGAFMVPSLRASIMNGARDGIDKARDTLFPNFDPIRPVTVAASSELPDHKAVDSADLTVNTYWAEAAEAEGIGQTVTYTFNESFELAKVLVTPGAIDPNQPDLFLKQPRPREIHLEFDNGSSTDITLKDEVDKAQTFSVKAKGIKTVTLSITSVFPGTGGQDTAIAEVEFRKRA